MCEMTLKALIFGKTKDLWPTANKAFKYIFKHLTILFRQSRQCSNEDNHISKCKQIFQIFLVNQAHNSSSTGRNKEKILPLPCISFSAGFIVPISMLFGF